MSWDTNTYIPFSGFSSHTSYARSMLWQNPEPIGSDSEANYMGATFANRLNRLFETVYPPGRGPHSSAEAIASLKAEGVMMSAPYLSQLRSGNRTNPSIQTMQALANF